MLRCLKHQWVQTDGRDICTLRSMFGFFLFWAIGETDSVSSDEGLLDRKLEIKIQVCEYLFYYFKLCGNIIWSLENQHQVFFSKCFIPQEWKIHDIYFLFLLLIPQIQRSFTHWQIYMCTYKYKYIIPHFHPTVLEEEEKTDGEKNRLKFWSSIDCLRHLSSNIAKHSLSWLFVN